MTYFPIARKASSTLTPVFALVSINGTPYSYDGKNIRRASAVCVVENMTTRSRHTLPSPASLRPPPSQPSPRPCLPVRRQQGEEKTSHHSGGEGSQRHHAISYSETPPCQPARPLICRQLAEPELLHNDEMSETPPLAEEQRSHRLMPAVPLLSQQMI